MKKLEKTERLQMLITPAQKKRLKLESKKRKWTVTTLVETAIEEFLKSAKS